MQALTGNAGASAFIGLGAYIYLSGKQHLQDHGHVTARKSGSMGGVRMRLRGLALLSSTFVGMGVYRLIN